MPWKWVCFNAARGKWSVATLYNSLSRYLGGLSFNAARGKWSVATKILQPLIFVMN